MTTSIDLLRRAQQRAAERRDRYRAAGFWSAEPLDVVRAAARRRPDGTALIHRDAQLSYAELDERVDRRAAGLLRAGVRAGVPVLAVVGNDVDSVVAVHAAIRVDAVVLLVPRGSGAAGVADIARRTGARFGLAPNWPDAPAAGLPDGFAWLPVSGEKLAEPVPEPARAADEPSFVLFTSGTTAAPKGVIHSLSTLAKASVNYIDAAGLTGADRLFLISPLGSVTGVVQALFIAPMLEVAVVLEDRWDPAATCALLVDTGATWYGGPDRLLNRLLDEAAGKGVEIPLRAVYLGGTMLDRRIVERAEDAGIVVMRAYGSSEVPVSTSGLRGEPREVRHADDGRPLADVEVKVGSATEPTECCIRGPHAFLGYTDAADEQHAFEDDWFRTGDAADLADGRVRIVGRLRDIVIRNGLKIPAAEVDEAISRIPGVRDCASYPVPDATTGEHLAVAVVADPGTELTLQTVADALTAAGLPKYKLPEELVFWDEPLPVNANGKVERKKLADRAAGRPRQLAARLASG
ncbi:AMP-binding enzyme family protein [Mycolicibacterium hassiacum DSM 44199]|uniref:AMP-binding enzyme family protein n=1 Tax=Mycolicibacterium hassiacum (strain DSM 44199 / CIP 105218 / JCM 12690 / 3849) TaxID=1122247 RepID=K5BIL9_MYCHD|nr:AMP-binding protein [Mycolicibacterium hassiacum]EKF21594.1 AMP-binding enzyme family protein [Mycolicibacterium hassiacum DSM 44199]MBX5487442.1 AMP-binding protein [Mycolicibacterium hassiacum]MDA4085028.1 AMP-dependent synthetase [Mycolicibacterium hassiacum DSM 44199]VCT89057.1 Salicylyl-CoA synthase / salicylate adenylyltransferase [Mycolicibacterium hassiacum DSM 44199]